MINDLNKTFAQELQRTINPRLKNGLALVKLLIMAYFFDPSKNLVWV